MTLGTTRRWTWTGLLACCAALAAGAEPQSQPATRPAAALAGAVKEAVARLGSNSYKDREAAQEWLIDHVEEAEEALTDASVFSPDAEIRIRAERILNGAVTCLKPEATEQDRSLMQQTTDGDPATRHRAVMLLARTNMLTDRGIMRLLTTETDPGLRSLLSDAMWPVLAEAVEQRLRTGTLGAMLTRMEATGEERMLQNAAAMRALLDEYKIDGGTPAHARAADSLAAFHAARARGNSAEALRIATILHLEDEREEILGLQGDWAGVVRVMRENQHGETRVNGVIAAELFASGGLMTDETFHKAMDLAVDPADISRQMPAWKSMIEMMLLGGRLDDAIRLMQAGGDYATAVKVMDMAERYGDIADAAGKRAAAGTSADLAAVAAGRAMLSLGQWDKADALLKPIEEKRPTPENSYAIAMAMKARAESWQADKARVIFMRMLETGDSQVISRAFTEYFHIPGPMIGLMEGWLAALNSATPALSDERKVRLLTDIATRRVAPVDVPMLRGLVIDGRIPEAASDLSRISDPVWTAVDQALGYLQDLPDAGTSMGVYDAVLNQMTHLAANPNKNAAISLFSRLAQTPALRSDRLLYAYMAGWAMDRAGDPAGKTKMHEASICLAADGWTRRRLVLLLLKAGDDAGAMEEARHIARFCGIRDVNVSSVFVAVSEAAGRVAPVEGVNLMQTYFFLYEQSGSVFSDANAPLELALLNEAARVRAALKAGGFDGAMRQWREEAAHWRMDSDLAIDLVRALDAAGRHDDANKICAEVTAHIEGQLKDFPDSPMLHNNLAWFLARARHDLAAARTHAEKCAAVSPHDMNAADTLAEVEWASGNREKAVRIEEGVVKESPEDTKAVPRLEHFKKDKPESYDGE